MVSSLGNLVRKRPLLGSGAVPSISGLARLGKFGEPSSLGTDVPIPQRSEKQRIRLCDLRQSVQHSQASGEGESGWLRSALAVGM